MRLKSLLLFPVGLVLGFLPVGFLGGLCALMISVQSSALSPPSNVGANPRPAESWKLPPTKPSDVYTSERLSADEYTDWSVASVNAPAAWAKGITGKGVAVAVLDTGAALSHRDLKEGIKKTKDFTRNSRGVEDGNGHGTHCAGSIGARKNGWGVIGVAYDCDLYVGKILSDAGSGTTDDIAAAVDWAVAEGADVISLSIGGGGSDEFLPVAFAKAERAGVIIVVAAGNDGNGSPVNYPARYPQATAISAVDVSLRLANFSCTGPEIACTGPGVKVRSCYPGGGDGLFADLSGTSMATPNVAGVAALWCQANKTPKVDRPAAWKKWLATGGCTDLGAKGRDASFGWGLPDASKLNASAPVPVPTPDTLIIDESDLNQKGLDKLKGRKFRVEIGVGAAAPVPSIDCAALEKLFESGVFPVIFIGKENVDLVKYPKGLLLTDPPPQISPGVYQPEVEKHWVFVPLK